MAIDFSPEAIAARNAKSQREAVEGFRKMQQMDSINFADMFAQGGNHQAAKEFRETVDNPDYDLEEGK